MLCLLKPTYLTELHLPKPRDLPKTQIKLFSYNPKPTVYLSPGLGTPTFTRTYLFSRMTLPKPRDWKKKKK